MKEYTKQEVLDSSIEYFNGEDLAATTWMDKYALKTKDESGNKIYLELNPEHMHRRLAKELARIESKYPNPLNEEQIFGYLDRFKYILPQGGSMSTIGNDQTVQSISNCFVIGNPENSDSYGGIFRLDEEMVQLSKRRGGCGFDLSNLRPQGATVTNAADTTSGVVSFMERYSNSIREVGQGGRRGALMLTLSIKHPDASRFIDAKVDTTKITGANCSIKLTDEFMKCVRDGNSFLQTFPITATNVDLFGTEESIKYSDLEVDKLYFGKKKNTFYRLINSKELWDKIIHNAWKSAEPGVLFFDTIISESPADCYAQFGFRTVSTNPCKLHCMA